MQLSLFLTAALLPACLAQVDYNSSSKRGLVFVPSDAHPSDNQIWVENGSDLTWYYNYGSAPSAAYANRTQSEWEFVPMLFSTAGSSTFLSDIQSMVQSGRNISHVLTFNEPDGTTSTGGSAIAPAAAAAAWIAQVEPLRKMGIKTGAPACTGSEMGFTWLSNFFGNCTQLGTNCTADFIPVHWYGNFEGLASHLGQVYGTYNKSIWVTEYALNDASLTASQAFFNASINYFDNTLDYIDRYSYFGSFRSDVSNVGPNAAMLTQKGALTDIGSWYLGMAATNNIPGKSAASKPALDWRLLALASVGLLVL